MKPMIFFSALVTTIFFIACSLPAVPEPTQAPALQPTARPANSAASNQREPSGAKIKKYAAFPQMTIDPSAGYTANIKTNKGNILIELFPASAPKTVNNFVFLANDGFYDGVIFHRVIPNFMIQGGDPTGTGTSGPGYKFEDEIDNTLEFDKPGILAMANAGPGTNGSQFFITTAATPHLKGNHTIFGKVLEGQDVASAISTVPSGPGNRPTQPIVIQGVEITKN
ncbi:MAG: peptidylprolyl isomerase [Chloroflexota bacterium]|nr:peptidylprolyl isomerase [Chloroflexota bacterium]